MVANRTGNKNTSNIFATGRKLRVKIVVFPLRDDLKVRSTLNNEKCTYYISNKQGLKFLFFHRLVINEF
jgi:hypothetical protein